jgi:hypothetical protein
MDGRVRRQQRDETLARQEHLILQFDVMLYVASLRSLYPTPGSVRMKRG